MFQLSSGWLNPEPVNILCMLVTLLTSDRASWLKRLCRTSHPYW